MKNSTKSVLLLICLLLFLPLFKTCEKEKEEIIIEKAEYDVHNIIVYNTRHQTVMEMDIEEYLIGVVAAEMPASFSLEALKAQAVAARTYALGRAVGKYGGSWDNHFGASVCTDSRHCQAWISKEMYEAWYPDSDVEANWAKVTEAVYDTRGYIITYEGEVINPLYHANSGGMTENVQEVWNISGEVPYLRTVYSPDESGYSSYERKVVITGEELRSMLLKNFSDIVFMGSLKDDLEVIEFTDTRRVKDIKVGSKIIPGTKFRELFSLYSTQIDINHLGDDQVEIITKGFGHGVGMSQCGANELAKAGKDFIYILEYYYSGVEIEPVTENIKVALNN